MPPKNKPPLLSRTRARQPEAFVHGKRAGTGRKPALESVVSGIQEHRAFLLRVARMRISDFETADDIVQDTLVGALRGAPSFAGRSSIRTWLVGILKNKIADHMRGGYLSPIPLSRLAGETDLSDLDSLFDHEGIWDTPPSAWNAPEQAIMDRDFVKTLESCLSRLPKVTARAFIMREVMDMGSREICSELAITANHLGVLLYRARMSLRICLDRNWMHPREIAHGL